MGEVLNKDMFMWKNPARWGSVVGCTERIVFVS